MNILDKIIAQKKEDIAFTKTMTTIKKLEQSIYYENPVVSLTAYLQRQDKTGIIAEIKRASPSTGMMQELIHVEKLSIAYMQAGAAALSVLTEQRFFGGSLNDLMIARDNNYCPILQKDFIIDEYQIIEAKSYGADCILLIAACLEPAHCKALATFAQSLGLEVLLEVHNAQEIHSHLSTAVNLVGVNNRNLQSFETDIENSIKLADKIPNDFVKISESGITNAKEIVQLKSIGFSGFLIGGHFMKSNNPAQTCKELIDNIQKLNA